VSSANTPTYAPGVGGVSFVSDVQNLDWLDIHFTIRTSYKTAAPLAKENAARHYVLRSLINLRNEYRVYRLHKEGGRTAIFGIPACTSLGIDISPSTETLNFFWERKNLISFIKLIENCISDNLDGTENTSIAPQRMSYFYHSRLRGGECLPLLA
jgi:hypothetical protein